MCMTGSDLNSSSKSWDDQENTTAIIYEEFYEQVPDIFMANNVLYLVLKNMVFDNHRKCLIQYYKKLVGNAKIKNSNATFWVRFSNTVESIFFFGF